MPDKPAATRPWYVRVRDFALRVVDVRVLALCAACILLNLAGDAVAERIQGPLYLDCAGTLIAAIVGGYLPGMFVGLATDLIMGMAQTAAPFYGIIAVAEALAASFLARRGWFSSVWKSLLSIPLLVLISTVLSALVTWFTAAPQLSAGWPSLLASTIQQLWGWPSFAALAGGSLVVEAADKTVEVAFASLMLLVVPHAVWDALPNGRFLYRDYDPTNAAGHPVYHSLATKMLVFMTLGIGCMGVVSICATSMLYVQSSNQRYQDSGNVVLSLMQALVPTESLAVYQQGGAESPGYGDDLQNLQTFCHSIGDVDEVWLLSADDPETPETDLRVLLSASNAGQPQAFGQAFALPASAQAATRQIAEGTSVSPFIDMDEDGPHYLVMQPLRDGQGATVAYGAVSFNASAIIQDRQSFVAKSISLYAAIGLLVIAAAHRLIRRQTIDPLNRLTHATLAFAFDSSQTRHASSLVLESLDIRTNDEIQRLYEAILKTMQDMSGYVDEIRAKMDAISRLQDVSATGFAAMVESRDGSTGGHIRRTSAYVAILVRQLQHDGSFSPAIDDAFVRNMTRAAPLHDLGKIRVPDAILNKPGKLTEQEFAIMKHHTVWGAQVLNGVLEGVHDLDGDFADIAIDTAHYHHEKWDGTGYPEGLAGNAIPLCARIMAVADVFDALVSNRVYKQGLPFDKALEIIQEEAGRSFDADVVAAFTACADDIHRTQAELRETIPDDLALQPTPAEEVAAAQREGQMRQVAPHLLARAVAGSQAATARDS